MKKFMAMALLLILIAGLLTACGRTDGEPATVEYDAAAADPATQEVDETEEPEEDEDDTPDEVWQGGPTRGRWVDNMYINEYLNLRFMMPHGWAAAYDEDIAELAGLGADVLAGAGHELSAEFWEAADILVLIDMLAADPFGGVSVQVIYERMVFPFNRLSEAEYIQRSISDIEPIGNAYALPGTTRIGDYDWHAVRFALDAFGGEVVNLSFVNIQDGFARMILITYNMAVVSSPADEILARFSSLDTPAPPPDEAPPAPEPEALDEALIGAWVWEQVESYILVFEADGQGVRGYYPDDLESFTWRTYPSDDHLIITLGFIQESWTYTIVGDVVTIDSRQVPGMTFSYVRWEGDFIPYEAPDLTGHPLVGTWAWDGGPAYLYVFNEDGTGTRGFPGQIEQLYWYAYDDHLLMETGIGLESWTFVIDDDVLTIDSRQANLTWSYIRQ